MHVPTLLNGPVSAPDAGPDASTHVTTALPASATEGLVIVVFLVLLAMVAFWRVTLQVLVAAILTAITVALILFGTRLTALAAASGPSEYQRDATPVAVETATRSGGSTLVAIVVVVVLATVFVLGLLVGTSRRRYRLVRRSRRG